MKFTDSKKTTVFSIVGHSMVAAGAIRYKITYEETRGWWKFKWTEQITEYKEFVIVNDGWKNGKDKYGNIVEDLN